MSTSTTTTTTTAQPQVQRTQPSQQSQQQLQVGVRSMDYQRQHSHKNFRLSALRRNGISWCSSDDESSEDDEEEDSSIIEHENEENVVEVNHHHHHQEDEVIVGNLSPSSIEGNIGVAIINKKTANFDRGGAMIMPTPLNHNSSSNRLSSVKNNSGGGSARSLNSTRSANSNCSSSIGSSTPVVSTMKMPSRNLGWNGNGSTTPKFQSQGHQQQQHGHQRRLPPTELRTTATKRHNNAEEEQRQHSNDSGQHHDRQHHQQTFSHGNNMNAMDAGRYEYNTPRSNLSPMPNHHHHHNHNDIHNNYPGKKFFPPSPVNRRTQQQITPQINYAADSRSGYNNIHHSPNMTSSRLPPSPQLTRNVIQNHNRYPPPPPPNLKLSSASIHAHTHHTHPSPLLSQRPSPLSQRRVQSLSNPPHRYPPAPLTPNLLPLPPFTPSSSSQPQQQHQKSMTHTKQQRSESIGSSSYVVPTTPKPFPSYNHLRVRSNSDGHSPGFTTTPPDSPLYYHRKRSFSLGQYTDDKFSRSPLPVLPNLQQNQNDKKSNSMPHRRGHANARYPGTPLGGGGGSGNRWSTRIPPPPLSDIPPPPLHAPSSTSSTSSSTITTTRPPQQPQKQQQQAPPQGVNHHIIRNPQYPPPPRRRPITEVIPEFMELHGHLKRHLLRRNINPFIILSAADYNSIQQQHQPPQYPPYPHQEEDEEEVTNDCSSYGCGDMLGTHDSNSMDLYSQSQQEPRHQVEHLEWGNAEDNGYYANESHLKILVPQQQQQQQQDDDHNVLEEGKDTNPDSQGDDSKDVAETTTPNKKEEGGEMEELELTKQHQHEMSIQFGPSLDLGVVKFHNHKTPLTMVVHNLHENQNPNKHKEENKQIDDNNDDEDENGTDGNHQTVTDIEDNTTAGTDCIIGSPNNDNHPHQPEEEEKDEKALSFVDELQPFVHGHSMAEREFMIPPLPLLLPNSSSSSKQLTLEHSITPRDRFALQHDQPPFRRHNNHNNNNMHTNTLRVERLSNINMSPFGSPRQQRRRNGSSSPSKTDSPVKQQQQQQPSAIDIQQTNEMMSSPPAFKRHESFNISKWLNDVTSPSGSSVSDSSPIRILTTDTTNDYTSHTKDRVVKNLDDTMDCTFVFEEAIEIGTTHEEVQNVEEEIDSRQEFHPINTLSSSSCSCSSSSPSVMLPHAQNNHHYNITTNKKKVSTPAVLKVATNILPNTKSAEDTTMNRRMTLSCLKPKLTLLKKRSSGDEDHDDDDYDDDDEDQHFMTSSRESNGNLISNHYDEEEEVELLPHPKKLFDTTLLQKLMVQPPPSSFSPGHNHYQKMKKKKDEEDELKRREAKKKKHMEEENIRRMHVDDIVACSSSSSIISPKEWGSITFDIMRSKEEEEEEQEEEDNVVVGGVSREEKKCMDPSMVRLHTLKKQQSNNPVKGSSSSSSSETREDVRKTASSESYLRKVQSSESYNTIHVSTSSKGSICIKKENTKSFDDSDRQSSSPNCNEHAIHHEPQQQQQQTDLRDSVDHDDDGDDHDVILIESHDQIHEGTNDITQPPPSPSPRALESPHRKLKSSLKKNKQSHYQNNTVHNQTNITPPSPINQTTATSSNHERNCQTSSIPNTDDSNTTRSTTLPPPPPQDSLQSNSNNSNSNSLLHKNNSSVSSLAELAECLASQERSISSRRRKHLQPTVNPTDSSNSDQNHSTTTNITTKRKTKSIPTPLMDHFTKTTNVFKTSSNPPFPSSRITNHNNDNNSYCLDSLVVSSQDFCQVPQHHNDMNSNNIHEQISSPPSPSWTPRSWCAIPEEDGNHRMLPSPPPSLPPSSQWCVANVGGCHAEDDKMSGLLPLSSEYVEKFTSVSNVNHENSTLSLLGKGGMEQDYKDGHTHHHPHKGTPPPTVNYDTIPHPNNYQEDIQTHNYNNEEEEEDWNQNNHSHHDDSSNNQYDEFMHYHQNQIMHHHNDSMCAFPPLPMILPNVLGDDSDVSFVSNYMYCSQRHMNSDIQHEKSSVLGQQESSVIFENGSNHWDQHSVRSSNGRMERNGRGEFVEENVFCDIPGGFNACGNFVHLMETAVGLLPISLSNNANKGGGNLSRSYRGEDSGGVSDRMGGPSSNNLILSTMRRSSRSNYHPNHHNNNSSNNPTKNPSTKMVLHIDSDEDVYNYPQSGTAETGMSIVKQALTQCWVDIGNINQRPEDRCNVRGQTFLPPALKVKKDDAYHAAVVESMLDEFERNHYYYYDDSAAYHRYNPPIYTHYSADDLMMNGYHGRFAPVRSRDYYSSSYSPEKKQQQQQQQQQDAPPTPGSPWPTTQRKTMLSEKGDVSNILLIPEEEMNDEQFQIMYDCTKQEFYELPAWKRVQIRAHRREWGLETLQDEHLMNRYFAG